MRIQHNIPGMRTLRYGRKLNNGTAKTLEKLSSGYCINRAGDDAAGLAVSERIRMSLTEFGRCKSNIQEGINLANTADAALQEVNDMLNRAQELCVTAANGTYSQQEKAELQKELDALYSEVDRIFESSRFNEVELFRHEDNDYSNGRFEYVEKVIETTSDDLQSWGALEGIDKKFDLAEPADPAKVTLPLHDIDVNDAQTLIGKSFSIKANDRSTYDVTFTSGTNSGYSFSWDLSIGVDDCTTVQDAFKKLCRATSLSTYWIDDNIVFDEDNTTVNTDENGNPHVTIAFKPTLLQQEMENVNGAPGYFEVADGNAQINNGVTVSSTEGKSLSPVDGTDSSDNTVVYADTATYTTRLIPSQSSDHVLSDTEKASLLSRSLSITGLSPIEFTNSGESGKIDIRTIDTVGALRSAIVDHINTDVPNLTAQLTDSSSGRITLTRSGLSFISTTSPSYTYLQETAPNITHLTTALDVSVHRTSQAGKESIDAYTITLPDVENTSDLPDAFSISINGYTYNFCNVDKLSETYPGATFSGVNVNTSNQTPAQIYEKIRTYVDNRFKDNEAHVELSGNTITITGRIVNHPLDVQITGIEQTLTQTGFLLSSSNSSYSFTQGSAIPLNLSTATNNLANINGLIGRGFKLGDYLFEFTDGTSTNGFQAIDISNAGSYEDIRKAMETAIKHHYSAFTVDALKDNNGIENGAFRINLTNSYTLFTDGYAGEDGLFTTSSEVTASAQSSGGTDAKQPTATIDFSKYNKDNFRELYGKGFRVTCATCKGEYINVIFCYDKAQADFPDSFDVEDTNSGEMRTIHNLAVELKDMNNGNDIVRAIVEQLTPELDHYTEVAGIPSSVLEVRDKRRGNIYVDDNNNGVNDENELRQAEILSGVYTNCIYTVEEQFVPAPDAVLGDIEIDYRFVKIYTNSESDNEYIDIHLPYLTLENLKLNPPEPDLSTTESATATLERANAANNVISLVRGTLGADRNRLEHAYADLAQAEEQAADAFSRIRDTDMAELMMEQTKLTILTQAQQAAQSHTMQQPQSVLKLMQ